MCDKMPNPSEAERWITPDIFVYQGKHYEVDIHGKVKPAQISWLAKVGKRNATN